MSRVKVTPWHFKANAGDDDNDGDIPERAEGRLPEPPIEIPPLVNVRRLYIRRVEPFSLINPRQRGQDHPGLGRRARRHASFSLCFRHSEHWTPRNEALLEAVLKRARVTKRSWLLTCYANMSQQSFEKSLWLQRNWMHVVAPKEASTCRSKSAKGEWIERSCDSVIACNSLRGKSHKWRWWKTLSRGHTKPCPLWLKGKRRYRNGMSRRCRRCFLATVEEGCQEEVQK